MRSGHLSTLRAVDIGVLLYRFGRTRVRFRVERWFGVKFKGRCYHGYVLTAAGCGACLRDATERARV